ncbi:hypothetical protein GJAV_G00022330 [Gymnothorax javanicus]|nr:hypothetical protein GJAV_G00022330 [Gymnothorax javanicus]
MAETRVIPSGKVYRQMFDAQVQLYRTLRDSRRRRVANEESLRCNIGPTTHDTDTDPNRDQLSSGARHLQESVEPSLEEEVLGLPDTVVAAKLGSDIVERLAEKKKRSHEEIIAKLNQDLTELSSKWESSLRMTADEFLSRRFESIENDDRLIQKLDNDSELHILTFQDLQDLWGSLTQGSEVRRKEIQELHTKLSRHESERTASIAELLKTCTSALERVGHMAAHDLHRLINSEAMTINQASLANRRALARLYMNLMEEDLQGSLSHRLLWEDRLQSWKSIKVQASVNQFRDFMSGSQIQSPEAVQATLDTLRMEQKSLSERRVETLRSLSSLVPPECCTELADQWFSSLSSVNKQMDSLHLSSMTELRLRYEQTYQRCLKEVDRFKEEVVGYGLPLKEIEEIVCRELLPLIGQRQSQAEEWLETMDRAFESAAQRVGAAGKALYGFAEGAVCVWEGHSARLQRVEQQLQGQLEELQRAHEQRNQKKEAELDLVLDRLRQESSEETLQLSLDKALHVLEEIKNGKRLEAVERYPATVLREMQAYSQAVSGVFRVKEIYHQSADELLDQSPIKLDLIRSSTKEGRGQNHGFEDLTSSSHEQINTKDSTDSMEQLCVSPTETFTTPKGNVYTAQSLGTQGEPDGDEMMKLPEVERVAVPESLLCELQREVRAAFLTHLEDWYQTAVLNALNIVAAKREELKSGLDLQVDLLQSRAKRIETEIHNVRAEELVLHRDHVEKYLRNVEDTLSEIRIRVRDLQHRHQEQTDEFSTQINALENVFASAANSDKMGCMSPVSCSPVRCYVHGEANAQFIKSFRLFSYGGNYTSQEIDVFQKQLEKEAKRVDSTEEAITLDMEGTESRCLEQAKDVISAFEEKFRFLIGDLKFAERVRRVFMDMQVQIKAEVARSNMQKKTLGDMLMQLESDMKACAKQHSEDMKVVLDDISTLACSIMEELKKWSQYLGCSEDPSVSVPSPDSPLQGAFAVAARSKSRLQNKPNQSAAADNLLQPSRMGVTITDDAAVGVVWGLLRVSKQKVGEDARAELPERGLVSTGGRPTLAVSAERRYRGGGTPGTPALDRQTKSAESVRSPSVQRMSKLSRSDKRFQVFGTSQNEQHTAGFNGLITHILRNTNDLLLSLAEEFYKRRERRPITRPQLLRETFELCAEEMNKRLLTYQSQTLEYHSNCLRDFKEQLRCSQEHLSQRPSVLLSHPGDQHLGQLSRVTAEIYRRLELMLPESEDGQVCVRRQGKKSCVTSQGLTRCELEQKWRLAPEGSSWNCGNGTGSPQCKPS